MEKAKPNEWLLYAAALCGFCGGVFLFLPESGGADAFRRGVLCAFPGLADKTSLALCYLLLALPFFLLFLCSFSRLATPGCTFVLALKGLLSGYACRAMLQLRGDGSAGILCYLLYLLSEGEFWLLTLAIARRAAKGESGLSGIGRKKAGDLFLDLLFCCGLLLPLLLLRGLLCAQLGK